MHINSSHRDRNDENQNETKLISLRRDRQVLQSKRDKLSVLYQEQKDSLRIQNEGLLDILKRGKDINYATAALMGKCHEDNNI